MTGDLKVKVYRKKDGTDGTALIIERPSEFRKIRSSNSEPQLPQQSVANEPLSLEDIMEMEAVSASATTADNNSGQEEHECLTPAEADTAPQEPHAETAPQSKQLESTRSYAYMSWRTQYPLATPEDEDELPF